MQIKWFVVAASLAAVAVLTGPAQAQSKAKIVAYVPNWNDLKAYAPTIAWGKVTHVNVAFENPDDSGDLSFNAQNALLLVEARKHRVPVYVSIGGGSASENKVLLARYAELLSDAKRAGFAAKIADYLVRHGFDGVDVDLEGPCIGPNYGAFIADLARVVKAQKKGLTAALSQGYGGDNVPASVFALFDWVNIMAYDAAGPWNPDVPGQHSSFEFAKQNVEYWLKRGLPKNKAVLGVPFYGYGFGKAFRNGDYPYNEIVAAYPGAENRDEVGNTVWYNGVATIRAKAAYAREQGLAGVMVWSLNLDSTGSHSLLTALQNGLTKPKPRR